MTCSNLRPVFGFILIAALSLALSACGASGSVVSDSSGQSKAANASPSAPASTPESASAAATPASSTFGEGAAQSSPSPTLHPAFKQAQAQPGVPVAVPESVRRPLNKEEMEKALQQLPPEVRARIMGMQKSPAPSPQATKK